MTEIRETYSPLFPRGGTRVHAMLVNCGHECVTSPSYSWDGMKRGSGDLVIWQYTLSGRGALDFGGRTIPLVPGTGFLVVVPEEHRYYLPKDSPGWEFIYASLNGSEAVRIAGECRRRSGVVQTCPPDGAVVRAAWRLLDLCRNDRLAGPYAASGAAYDFLMHLLSASEKTQASCDEALVGMVHDYCLQNISRPVSVEDAARLAGLSRWHFSRRFKKASGRSPHDFITDLKMRMAVRRLQSSRDSVKEISLFCGFEDPAYFCKVFKHIYGAPPAEFRSGAAAAKD
ncbi:MAG: AraC family transcriptional regulator [Lentisphaeria bacterium]|nr:AraC family transcriptional regulator [Lentisphaeria bacterium]